MEEWKDIPNYEGLYQVSDQGRFRSLPKLIIWGGNGARVLPGKNLKLVTGGNTKYLRCCFRNDSGCKNIYIHRIVALVFVPNPYNLPNVNHIDNDKRNNRKSNFEWVSKRENSSHGLKFKKTNNRYVGVWWDKKLSKWRVVITYQNKRIHIGLFNREPAAIRAYRNYMKKLKVTNKYHQIK